MFYCKLGEFDGLDCKKTAKASEIKIKVPEWVIQTSKTTFFIAHIVKAYS